MCWTARSAELSVSPSRSAGAASEAVWRVRNVVRSASVPRCPRPRRLASRPNVPTSRRVALIRPREPRGNASVRAAWHTSRGEPADHTSHGCATSQGAGRRPDAGGGGGPRRASPARPRAGCCAAPATSATRLATPCTRPPARSPTRPTRRRGRWSPVAATRSRSSSTRARSACSATRSSSACSAGAQVAVAGAGLQLVFTMTSRRRGPRAVPRLRRRGPRRRGAADVAARRGPAAADAGEARRADRAQRPSAQPQPQPLLRRRRQRRRRPDRHRGTCSRPAAGSSRRSTGPQDMCAGQDRLLGYRRALDETGTTLRRATRRRERVHRRRGQRRDGAAARCTDPTSTGCSRRPTWPRSARSGRSSRAAAGSAGVPTRSSVVGFDDIRDAAGHRPPLTTVRQPIAEMGTTMTTRLLQRLSGRRAPASRPCCRSSWCSARPPERRAVEDQAHGRGPFRGEWNVARTGTKVSFATSRRILDFVTPVTHGSQGIVRALSRRRRGRRWSDEVQEEPMRLETTPPSYGGNI